jgi:hypothetical protein
MLRRVIVGEAENGVRPYFQTKMGYVPISNEQNQIIPVDQLRLVDVSQHRLDLR